MHYDDLPKSVREKVDAQLATEVGPKERVKVRRSSGPGALAVGAFPLRCKTCGALVVPPSEGRIRKHMEETDHRRFEVVLDGSASREVPPGTILPT